MRFSNNKSKNNKIDKHEQKNLKRIINICREKLNKLATANERIELTQELMEESKYLDELIVEFYRNKQK
jgi:hypothetical protein